MTDAVVDMWGDIIKLNEKFKFLISNEPTHLPASFLKHRANFIEEELTEFRIAIEMQDMADMADALIDIVVVTIGTAVMMGLPWGEMWEEVQRANMSKQLGRTHRGVDNDLIKPDGWIPPQHEQILATKGYSRRHWEDEEGNFDEELCAEVVL